MNNLEGVRAAYEARVRTLAAEIEARERQLAILAEVAAAAHGESEPQAVLDQALEVILGRLGLTCAWIFLGDQRDRELQLAAARGVASSYLEEVRTRGLGDCLCPEVFWTGHRMLARNTVQCPRMPTIVEGLDAPVAHACIPLELEGQRRGVLNVAARPNEAFSDADLRFLETLGHQVCIAMERAEHLHAERRRNQEARALAAISRAIGGSLNTDNVLDAVGRTARELLDADRIAILLGSDPQRMSVAYLVGTPAPDLEPGRQLDLVAIGAPLQMQALHDGSLRRLDDCTKHPDVNQDLARRWRVGSALVVPLAGRESVLGLLLASRERPRAWQQDQVEIAEALAAQASVALENARLYQQARQAYQEMKDAQRQLVQHEKMALLGTFASGLAHEVRNPLNSISLQLSILDRRVARQERGEGALRTALGVIREEIQRLDALVGDFLLFSRTSRVKYEPVQLDPLVDEVVRLLAPEADECGVELARIAPRRPVPVLVGDAEKLKQVVINLVRNAIEALPDGGHVQVATESEAARARISVHDDGPGLPQGLDIFQLFVTTKPKGTGLGLSIAQQIVLDHGGEIAAASEPDGGATFTVSLPLATEANPREVGT